MIFVFFHGIEQQDKNVDALRTLWVDSIRSGLDRAASDNPLPLHEQVVMPYYGDLLARLTPAVSTRINSEGKTRGTPAQSEKEESSRENSPSATMEQILREIGSARRGSHAKERDDSEQKIRGFKSNALGALSAMMPIAAQNHVVNRALKQVAAYLDDTDLKRAILEIASSAIQDAANKAEEGDEPLIVVAHSLGSVIALEALAEFTGRSVNLLMTIGSPLSTETVASRMNSNARRWPESVKKWVNVADPDDVVALHHAVDRRNFLRGRPDSEPGAVWNVVDIRNHMSNHHGIAGYLDDPIVAQLLTDSKLWL